MWRVAADDVQDDRRRNGAREVGAVRLEAFEDAGVAKFGTQEAEQIVRRDGAEEFTEGRSSGGEVAGAFGDLGGVHGAAR